MLFGFLKLIFTHSSLLCVLRCALFPHNSYRFQRPYWYTCGWCLLDFLDAHTRSIAVFLHSSMSPLTLWVWWSSFHVLRVTLQLLWFEMFSLPSLHSFQCPCNPYDFFWLPSKSWILRTSAKCKWFPMISIHHKDLKRRFPGPWSVPRLNTYDVTNIVCLHPQGIPTC